MPALLAMLTPEDVTAIDEDADGVVVHGSRGSVRAREVVLATGAWSTTLMQASIESRMVSSCWWDWAICRAASFWAVMSAANPSTGTLAPWSRGTGAARSRMTRSRPSAWRSRYSTS